MTNFRRRKNNHVPIIKREGNTRFHEDKISTFTIRKDHNQANTKVFPVPMNECGDIEIQNKAAEWINRGIGTTGKCFCKL